MSTVANQFEPDYAIPPGEILEETLATRGMKKAEFAERCGRSEKMVSQIISGQAPITAETAIQFERVLGVNASVWNNLEANYRLAVAKSEQQKALLAQKDWAKRFPINKMVKLGFIPKPESPTDRVEKLLDFFGVGSAAAWEERCARVCIAYRKSPSYKSAPESVAAWLRMGELHAEDIDCAAYNRERFIEALSSIRGLTRQPPDVFVPEMQSLCADAGVAVALVPELPKTHLSGAARWLTKDKALIMFSLRHKSDDHLWFTFFHEAGHILLHGKKDVFIDEEEIEDNDKEQEADRFARNTLIPLKEYRVFQQLGRWSTATIATFAEQLGIAPGIVVGRLQHDGLIPYSHYNKLKTRFVWKDNS
ncbi:MAG TPA: addiction module antidote protein, HigA family [Acidiferrobacteraceae bacterium]|nr:addiction module antidote protein, HigA family [Acidiferrobacteraceae bacterium]